MSGMNEEQETGQQAGDWGAAGPDQRPVAFCQNCGKPLNEETKRVVGPAVYCEPCLAARLGGFAGTGPAAGQATPDGTWQWSSAPPQGWGQKPGPNPGLAALLGLIPGVGAMYNEQYPKGIAHLVIFAVLVVLAHVSDIFILFIFGWIAYMSIEAHHTARARRDGTPLPNPFGLNDIGERMGFGRAWPAGPGVAAVARDAAEAAAAEFHSVSGGFGTRAAASAPPPGQVAAAEAAAATGAGWGAPVEAYGPSGYAPNPPSATNYGPQPGQAYASPGYGSVFGAGAGSGTGYGYGQAAYAVPPVGSTVPPTAPFPPAPPAPSALSRFPAGALWLIGLGTIFLLGTTGIFESFRGLSLIGVVLLASGVWVFVRRMTDTGATLGDDGSPLYRLRLVRALSGSVWLVLLGALLLFDSLGWMRWENNWPWLIIAAGVLMILKRAAYQAALPAYYPAPTAPVPGAQPVSGATSIVPAGNDVAAIRDDAEFRQGGN